MARKMKNSQRKAMFARLNLSKKQRKVLNIINTEQNKANLFTNITIKDINKRLKSKDIDGDGVINAKDCKPLDPKKQGLIHDFIQQKQDFEKKNARKLEEEQDLLLMRIDKESTNLKKAKKVNERILENKILKQKLSDLKRANFQQTKTGKIVVATRKGLIIVGKGGLKLGKFLRKQLK